MRGQKQVEIQLRFSVDAIEEAIPGRSPVPAAQAQPGAASTQLVAVMHSA